MGDIMMCEDYPCCGHERNDCDGSLYGSDEDIKARAHAALYAEDGTGIWSDEDEDEDEDEDGWTDRTWALYSGDEDEGTDVGAWHGYDMDAPTSVPVRAPYARSFGRGEDTW